MNNKNIRKKFMKIVPVSLLLTLRSSCWCSVKKLVLKNFAIFTGKHLCWSISLIKLKKTIQHRCFPVNIAKILRESILKNICEQLLLDLERVFAHLDIS